MNKLPRKSKELRAVLECLGFVVDVSSGRGGHYKYIHPTRKPAVVNQRPFITIPRHDFEHGRLHLIIKQQLIAFGFSKEEINHCC